MSCLILISPTDYTMGLYELKEAKALDQLNAVTKAKIEVNQVSI